MKNVVVIGLGFGDEGKGKVVSSLCEKYKNEKCIVVRYSGGSQAGHEVRYNGKKHIFSSFGSGTLQNIPTYWSHLCAFNPLSFVNELKVLNLQNINPTIYINPSCPVTTPFEVYANRNCNKNLSDGTCGMGYGKTMQREEDFYSLLYQDLKYPLIVKQKLNNFFQYYNFDEVIKAKVKDELEYFMSACYYITNYLTSNKNVIEMNGIAKLSKIFDTIIYESSQGLLLDQHNGMFPNVTRSDLGVKNLWISGIHETEIYLVTRSYLTKHGNGNDYLLEETKYINNPHEHNEYNEWQGNFKTGILNIDLIKYAIEKEKFRPNVKKYLVINCMDIKPHGGYSLIIDNTLQTHTKKESFLMSINKELGLEMYTSGDPNEIIKL